VGSGLAVVVSQGCVYMHRQRPGRPGRTNSGLIRLPQQVQVRLVARCVGLLGSICISSVVPYMSSTVHGWSFGKYWAGLIGRPTELVRL